MSVMLKMQSLEPTVTPDNAAAAPTIAYNPGTIPEAVNKSRRILKMQMQTLTISISSTCFEQLQGGIIHMQPLHCNTNDAANASTNTKSRDKNPSREFDTKCDYRQTALNNHGHQDGSCDGPYLFE